MPAGMARRFENPGRRGYRSVPDMALFSLGNIAKRLGGVNSNCTKCPQDNRFCGRNVLWGLWEYEPRFHIGDSLGRYGKSMGKKPANNSVRFWRDPDMPGLEVRVSSYREEAFRKHMHRAYSIGLIEAGRTVFYLEGETFSAEAGQMVFFQPEAVHACNPDSGFALTYTMFYVDEWLMSEIALEVCGMQAKRPVFASSVVEDEELFVLWRALHDGIEQGAERLERQSLMIQAMGQALARYARLGRHSSGMGRNRPETDCIEDVRVFLAENMCRKVCLEELAHVAGMSRYHLLRVFQDQMGLPPHAYQAQLRVNQGRVLLAGGMPIVQVAAELGFTDQSHFSRVFKQFTAATPRQYQDSLNSAPGNM